MQTYLWIIKINLIVASDTSIHELFSLFTVDSHQIHVHVLLATFSAGIISSQLYLCFLSCFFFFFSFFLLDNEAMQYPAIKWKTPRRDHHEPDLAEQWSRPTEDTAVMINRWQKPDCYLLVASTNTSILQTLTKWFLFKTFCYKFKQYNTTSHLSNPSSAKDKVSIKLTWVKLPVVNWLVCSLHLWLKIKLIASAF